MARTWSYRKRTIDVLAPKPKGLAAAVWAYIIFCTVFVTILTSGVIYLCTHSQMEDDSTPKMAVKLILPKDDGG
jgi:hypothetical protein